MLTEASITSTSSCSQTSSMISPTSPALFLVLLALTCSWPPSSSAGHGDGNDIDQQALLSFRSLVSDPARALESWRNTSLDFCHWHGVTCSTTMPGRVTTLDLSSCKLAGLIPPCIANLSSIERLDLSNNSFHGRIPTELGRLEQLRHLNLSVNSLDGHIPWLLGSGSSLMYVDLGANGLSGGIPEFLANSSSLQFLSLTQNKLTGELPRALFNTSSLTAIYLDRNKLFGSIPPVTAVAAPIQYLSLAENNLTSEISASIGNLSSLVGVSLAANNLVGSIPESLSRIPTLEMLILSINNLSGQVPQSIFNISSLKYLELANNSLIGRLPPDIGYMLPNLQRLILSKTRLSGPIPASLVNASKLEIIHLVDIGLTGILPSFGSLSHLQQLDLAYNQLEAGDWSFLSSLANCTQLQRLCLDGNGLQGHLPSSVGNLPSELKWLWLKQNKLSGTIPLEIGNLRSLEVLYMDQNLFTGTIPPSVGNLSNLLVLSFAQNNLSGHVPDSIGNLVKLTELYLDGNNFSGTIPASLGQWRHLEKLNLSRNSFGGSIPSEVFNISSLSQSLDLSHNSFAGPIPLEIGSLINLGSLSISNNRLTSNIPSTLGKRVLLESIKELDLSSNNLSGNIPEFFASMNYLKDLNLSFNDFDGPVPSIGIFRNASRVSLQGNDGLCANTPELGLPHCPALDRRTKHKSIILMIVVPIAAIVLVISLICLLTVCLKRREQKPILTDISMDTKIISYKDIVKATKGFSTENLVGSGSFGDVYKGTLELEVDLVAIKVFNLNRHGGPSSFIAECEALKNIRHRNLVKVITLCSTLDPKGEEFKAIIFQYMPNGSLETWLHQKVYGHNQKQVLTLGDRISIALDIAYALDYLHNQSASPLIHCDLKPSNVLLDLQMTAYVSDFGLARFMCTTTAACANSTSLADLKGSIGYIAPEYGMGGPISTKGDAYSYGVLLLEILTGKRPSDDKLKDSLSLHELVESAFPHKLDEILDPIMLQSDLNGGKYHTEIMQSCIIPMVKLGLLCSSISPKDRLGMSQVSAEMGTIRQSFLELQ
ncbi:probable LRR receptor-like serine/threonine-protein kinase At3g47570 [Oryza glaberrima]|uniref:probable LRR receptor-like serine/threonine-protein kinase At3g47570 n=1 Tax=Oryza glaberrima TaxID=4538 RepID=UPI00224C38D8|nr:probable LRR receptor-like serine/threonine-protein kinase At3g47570 [Oryza glaberrima]